MDCKFSFIDLFAGIGGIRIAFEKVGGQCVFSADYDPFAQDTYESYFGGRPDFAEIMSTNPPGDVTQLDPRKVPDHHILTAGFPCQPFSLAGISKKKSLGRPHGFNDPAQGTLFFTIKEILREKRPPAFLLENVKHLIHHDKKRTFRIIQEVLDELEYDIHYRIIDASGWTPQHRERIYIVGFRRPGSGQSWRITEFPELFDLESPTDRTTLDEVIMDNVPDKYTLGPGTWNTLVRHKSHHEAKGHGFGYGMISKPYKGKVTRTLSARYHKDGAEILIEQPGKERPRRLTPLECSRLMGFPKDFRIMFDWRNSVEQPVSDTQAYRQFGNSVAVPLVTDVARLIVKKMESVDAISC